MRLPKLSTVTPSLRISSAHLARSTARSNLPKRIGTRGYSSGGHETKKGFLSGDLPWLIGSLAVTVPVSAYLLSQTPAREHGHAHHSEEHSEDKEDGEDGKADEQDGEGGDSNSEEKEEDSEGDNDSEDDNAEGDDSSEEGQDTPDSSDSESEGKQKTSGVNFKGHTKDGPPEHNVKRYPDAKGGNKKRLESTYGKQQGVIDDDEENEDDKPATSKPPVRGSTSGKQEGVSNTDTKHSLDIEKDTGIGIKPEGPDTAKAKGTIDPNRPQK
ncbi:MAG: hypothetical protein M1825_002003 [Sarcosagium campestre]|nr:MAG: hypothetical protein M1825_002003 [Sarcosagium campestre]